MALRLEPAAGADPAGARRRWVVTVTLAEAIGYLAPALTGILTARAGWSERAAALAIVAAGFVEGFALGTGQARAFPFRVRRLRYALLTGVAAMVVWAIVLAMMVVAPMLPRGAAISVGLTAGVIALATIGSAQWIELQDRVPHAHRWVGWTALAWLLALPLSFAPGPLVDEATPLAVHVVLWGAGGLLMAFVMALVTWQGVRRLCWPRDDSDVHSAHGSARSAFVLR